MTGEASIGASAPPTAETASTSTLAPSTPARPSLAALRERIAALTAQTGRGALDSRPSPAPVGVETPPTGITHGVREAPADGSLADDLARLRAAQQHRDRARRRAEDALPGEPVAEGVRLVRSVHLLDHDVADTCCWEREPASSPLLFLDTETTGLAGGTGTLVFLLGLATLHGRELRVDQWLLTAPRGEGAWLDGFAASLPADFTLVSFNGKSFDLPLLEARARLQRRRAVFQQRPHWDLLAPLRRAFDTRWPDCRLQTAERRLLGVHRVDDLPGSFAPAAFHALVRQDDPTLMKRMLAHNRDDVVSLAKLLPALERVYRQPAAFDADGAAIAQRLVRHDRAALAEAALRGDPTPDARRALGRLLRRQRRDAEAESAYAPLVEGPRPCPEALESLAKIAEHRRRDASAALVHAERLAALQPHVEAHARRLARLRRKLGQSRP